MENASDNSGLSAADVTKVNAEVGKLLPLLNDAAKADKLRNNREQGISNALLSIAIECGERGIFNAACTRAEAQYKAKHKVKKLPKTWTKAKSDIKAMYDHDIRMTDAQGLPVSFSNAAKALNEARKAARKQAEKDVEASTPEHVKVLRGIVERIVSVQDSVLSKECADMLESVYTEYQRKHPELFQQQDDDGDSVQVAAAA